ncbi:hydrogenase [Candidatus Aerophobetes bacterium]|uniref:Hydrogenase n=1 Tax=Aerophobetes bacterium TaxID=2030807 RepID=A0A662D5M2_UNCAE|nr:MAG: hydrogenase [Candidatus Aerophobetes bacterium]
MAIAAYVVGAKKGYIYVRAEYPLAIKRLEIALRQAREYNLLGKNILEKNFDFDIELRVGAGAFVCGEETALLASIEGKRGMPRSRPPYPATSGLWGKPTLINNVETYANVRHIILNGAKWFSSIGTKKSKGTKVFALSGKVRNTGLIEVPMGTTIGELVFDIGGGVPNGKKFKAVQMGGPSGGCIPIEYLNTPISYESLKELGAIMGSGGVIVLDEDTCMVNLARFFIEFTASESCGKCVPCRVGLRQMLKILDKIILGRAALEDLDLLEYLAKNIKKTALCGLGQTAPNPVLSTLRYFRDEYEAHILEKRCPAAVCAALFIAPCQAACPAGVDVPAYVTHIANGDFKKAFYVHMQNNPLPGICGRVCYAFCERKCQRRQTDEPIAIRDLKRFIADYAMEEGLFIPPPENPRKEKVAIIGSGPAGLSCAFYLTRLGYLPVIYEALPVAGGTMAMAIPEYRLPRRILNYDIERIKKAGVEIKLSNPVEDIDSLFKMGYQAVFIATGTPQGQKLEIEGEDLEGVITGVDFLKSIFLNGLKRIEGDVVVIGGGNSAVDSARSALRLGARNVTIVYRRMKSDMPATEEEIEDALKEGVKILDMTMPIEIVGNERVGGTRCVKMKPGKFDSSGRRRPVLVEDSEFLLKADMVIISIGQRPNLEFLKNGKVKLNKWGFIEVNPLTMATSQKGVFAGGDVVSGPATVIEAVATGRKAAIAIDKYLGGDGIIVPGERTAVKTNYDEAEYLKERPRKVPQVLPLEKRKTGFEEVRLRFSLKQAMEEARRCLHCDREEE